MNAKEILKKIIFSSFLSRKPNKSKSVIKMLNTTIFFRMKDFLHFLSAFFYKASFFTNHQAFFLGRKGHCPKSFHPILYTLLYIIYIIYTNQQNKENRSHLDVNG